MIPKGEGRLSELPSITKRIAEQIKYADIYSSAKSEAALSGQPACAVWCYFGHDVSDIVNHLHYAYTIWAAEEETRKLLAMIVTFAEQFVADLQETTKHVLTIEEFQARYGTWAAQVKKKYIELSEGDIAPDDLHDWVEEILNLAGWVVDMAVLIEKKEDGKYIGERENWLIKHAVRQYHGSMERIKEAEAEITWQ